MARSLLYLMGMTRRFSEFLKIGVLLGVAIVLAACGGGGSAAPTGSGGTPVAVEIPALGEAAGLPFASAIVISGSSNIAAAIKATPSSWVYKSFNLEDGDAFTTGDAVNACQYRNAAGVAIGTFALPDQALCIIKDKAASFSDPYDGNYHILSTGVSMAGVPSKIKFKFVRNSSDIITTYEEFACDSTNTQITYVLYTISGSSLTATLKNIRTTEPQRTTVDLTATMSTADSNNFTAKSGSISFAGSSDAGALQGAIDMTQTATTLLLNSFDSRGDGSNIVRLYGQADQSNTTDPLSISGYIFGAGAATVIDNGVSSTQCWDINNDPTACSGSNYDAINGRTPMEVSTQTISDFSGSEAWDCSGAAEVTATQSFSDSSGCFQRFDLQSDYINCTIETQGYLTVTPSVSGSTLSTDSGSPTSVSATPSILLTASLPLDTSSMNSTTVKILDLSEPNEVLAQVSFSRTDYNSSNTTLTLSPTLTSGKSYKLVLVGSSSVATSGTVIRAPSGGEPPADQLQSTGTYYITVP